ncbi:MAG TPA: hypothetical protein PKY82_25485 [Pyrinomonadaceae bacterium]|nr:hypothetical protein [Pyrinomonadaceae bacterium]
MEMKEVLQSLVKNGSSKIDDSVWLKKLGFFSIGGVAALIICLLTIVISSTFHFAFGSVIIFVMILFGITLGFLTMTFFENFLPKKIPGLKDNEKNYFPIHPIESRNTNKQLKESTFESIPSVIENTTELFFVERPKTKTSGELG